jgi:hypothetical protein
VKCRGRHQNSTAPPDMIGYCSVTGFFLFGRSNKRVGETVFVSQINNTRKLSFGFGEIKFCNKRVGLYKRDSFFVSQIINTEIIQGS